MGDLINFKIFQFLFVLHVSQGYIIVPKSALPSSSAYAVTGSSVSANVSASRIANSHVSGSVLSVLSSFPLTSFMLRSLAGRIQTAWPAPRTAGASPARPACGHPNRPQRPAVRIRFLAERLALVMAMLSHSLHISWYICQ